MCDGTLFLTAEEMEKFGGPYLVYDGYYTPWEKSEIVTYVANHISLWDRGVQDFIARKMQQEFPMAEVSVEEGMMRFFFPLTKTSFYINETEEVQK